jgi:hypothetical protein
LLSLPLCPVPIFPCSRSASHHHHRRRRPSFPNSPIPFPSIHSSILPPSLIPPPVHHTSCNIYPTFPFPPQIFLTISFLSYCSCLSICLFICVSLCVLLDYYLATLSATFISLFLYCIVPPSCFVWLSVYYFTTTTSIIAYRSPISTVPLLHLFDHLPSLPSFSPTTQLCLIIHVASRCRSPPWEFTSLIHLAALPPPRNRLTRPMISSLPPRK